MDYSVYTVKELKEMVKGKPMAMVIGTKKADYIKALQDADAYEKSTHDFHKEMDQWREDMENKTKRVNEGITKIRDAVKKLDEKITSLKAKEDKSIEDYNVLVKLLEKKISLMKSW